MQRRSIVVRIRLSARGLERSVLMLAVESPLPRGRARRGRHALLARLRDAAYQLAQAVQRVLAILLLAAVLLSLDDDHTLLADAMVFQQQQAVLEKLGQRRGIDIETQMNGGGELIDVLSARTLRADRADLDLVLGNRYVLGNLEHGRLLLFTSPRGSVAPPCTWRRSLP